MSVRDYKTIKKKIEDWLVDYQLTGDAMAVAAKSVKKLNCCLVKQPI